MRTAILITVLAGALLSAGCAPPATPQPAGPPHPAGPSQPPVSSDGLPYPKLLDLAAYDPCQLLTEAQKADLRLDRPLIPSRANVAFGGAAACGTRSTALLINTRWVLAREPISSFTSGAKFRTELTKLPAIHGFPAYLSRITGHPDFCNVEIDAGPGQLIDIQYADDDSGTPKLGPEEMCAGARAVGEAVLTTLLSR